MLVATSPATSLLNTVEFADRYGWRSLYYLGAGLTVTAIGLRLVTPSYAVTADAVREREGVEDVTAAAAVGGNVSFLKKFRYAITKHWPAFIYSTALVAAYSLVGHGHMDV
jgi:MFS transporter, SHS family, lactate transporter